MELFLFISSPLFGISYIEKLLDLVCSLSCYCAESVYRSRYSGKRFGILKI